MQTALFSEKPQKTVLSALRDPMTPQPMEGPMHAWQWVVTILLVASIVLSGGCNTIRYGGAPPTAFNIENDLRELESEFQNAASLKSYYAGAQDKNSRNKFISARLVLMNLQYIKFVRTLTGEKQLLDSASDILVLSLNLAGTSFTSKATKTAMAAIAAAVGGTKVILDKEFFFEKTLPALVAAMNAERKATLLPILRGLKLGVDEYPMEQAIADLHQYYEAGTLYGAIEAIQVDAAGKEKDSKAEAIKISALPTQQEDDIKTQIYAAVRALEASKADDLTKIKRVLDTLKLDFSKAPNAEAVKTILLHTITQTDAGDPLKKLTDAVADAKIVLQPPPKPVTPTP
jgi:hypothetical protein